MGFPYRAARRVWLLAALALLLATVGAPQRPAYALIKDDPRETDPSCQEAWSIYVRLGIEGLHVGEQVVRTRPLTISAESVKVEHALPNCDGTLYPLPEGAFRWELAGRPAGSAAALTGADSLRPGLVPDRNGLFAIVFTACPGGCEVESAAVPEASFTLTLDARDEIAYPPATEPALPGDLPATQPSTIPDANTRCLGGGGVTDPQWVTVDQWGGASDYELLEGEVQKSRISRKDNPLNHDSQDHLMHVRPDPPLRRLLRGSQQIIEVEWERSHLPEAFRATPGDRLSAYGFWILDCGHDAPTEIHPPVMVAIHRARPVPIPPAAQFSFPPTIGAQPDGADPEQGVLGSVGTGVYVPGVITDIWFNREAGEITRNCSSTGLHQPGRANPAGQPPLLRGACIRSPAPLDRVFTFNIYLPPRPQLASSFTVPLYTEVLNHPYGFSAGPAPQVVLAGTDAAPYLRVSIDMRQFSGARYARQIRAGWVLAAPDNWGLARWRLRLNALDVHDDGDSIGRGDGDWRFWLNTTNGLAEWTKIFDCSGCVHGRMTFGGRPYQTGPAAEVSADRSLGPDPLLYPGQRFWVHSSGFEADGIVDDDTGAVNRLHPQRAAAYRSRSSCTEQTVSLCAEYTLEYEILAGPALAAPQLSQGARNLLAEYAIGPQSPQVPCLPCVDVDQVWYPFDGAYAPSQQPVQLSATLLYRSQPSLERYALTDISIPDLRDLFVEARLGDPARLATVMGELRAVVDERLGAGPALAGARIEDADEIAALLGALPDDLRRQYFGDIRLYTVGLPLLRR